MNSQELNRLRSQLDDLDRELVENIARRQALVRAIGRSKQQDGTPTRDFARERQVIEACRATAHAVGVDPGLAERVMQLLIEGSLSRQEIDRIEASGAGERQSALIIGGAGLMGRWFARFLRSQGYRVLISDPAGELPGFEHVQDWEEPAMSADMIIVAAPIQVTASILERMVDLQPPGLVFDIASLKSPLRSALRSLADSGCRVCSIHPLFGPDTRLLSDRHVVFVDLGPADAVAGARALFENTMVQAVEMGLEDHDRLMAYILGLSHVVNIAFFTALRESGEDATRLAELSSTTFDAQLEVAWRVAGENPALYFEIQSLNDYRKAPIRALSTALERIGRLIEADDAQGFGRLMQQGLEYLNRRRKNA